MNEQQNYAICVRNEGYPASLKVRKLHRAVPGSKARASGHIRVIDGPGEDYIYLEDHFVPLNLPRSVKEALEAAAWDKAEPARTLILTAGA